MNKPTGEALNITMDKDSSGTPPTSNPGSGNTLNNKDKDNPDGGSTDDNPSLLNLDGSSANNDPSSRDFSTSNLQASSITKASRFSFISVTRAILNKPTGEAMNITMDKDSFGTPPTGNPGGNDTMATGGATNAMNKVSFGTLLTDDPDGGNLHAGLWWTNMDYAIRSYVHDCGGGG